MEEILRNPVFIAAVAGHVLGDFLLQTRGMVDGKGRFLTLLWHAAVVAGVTYLLAGSWGLWQLPVGVLVLHMLIDAGKNSFETWSATGQGKQSSKARHWIAGHRLTLFLADQLLHLVSLGVLVQWVIPAKAASVMWTGFFGGRYVDALIYGTGFLLAVRAGEFITGLVVSPLRKQPGQGGDDGEGIERGGRLIGRLERALVFLFVLLGRYDAVGFLLAAKAILRYGSTSDERLRAEYVIIGTFTSMSVAILAALAVIGWVGLIG
jgi:hypothetical protein